MEISINGLQEFKEAILRNPVVLKEAITDFLEKGLRTYRETIVQNPWRIGMTGGGSPVRTGNLRDTHTVDIKPYIAKIIPTAPYADPVHKKRPWLDYAQEVNEDKIIKLADIMVDKVIQDLAK